MRVRAGLQVGRCSSPSWHQQIVGLRGLDLFFII